VIRGVIVIHPAGALVLASILRGHLVAVSRLKLSKEKRSATINAVLDYIQSPAFKNGIQGIIRDTVDLYTHLKKEVKEHLSNWQLRLEKYRDIYSSTEAIESKAVSLIADEKDPKNPEHTIEIKPIELPAEIP
jgi:hypothetical protein